MGFASGEVLGKFTSHVVSRVVTAFCFALLVFVSVGRTTATAQTYTVLHTFSGGGDGGCPITGLTSGPGRSFYGTTYRCGNGLGTVFKLKQMGAGWILNTLYRFQGGNDGNGPYGRVAVATDGTLYGTTYAGGTGYGICNNGCGTIFRLTPQSRAPLTALSLWNETVLYSFTGTFDGGEPQGDLTFDSSGNLYGTAYYGGTVYELIDNGSQWTPAVLDTLGNYNALGGVIFDSSGNLYGVSAFGGLYGQGTVYELSPSASGWTPQTLYNFTGQNDGLTPEGGLIMDSLGNLYGATAYAGNGYNGAVFEVSPVAGGWTFNTLYDLPSGPGVPAGPLDKLTMDANGNLYGTTYDGGANGVGSVFELIPSNGAWTFVSLHDFTGLSDGGFPASTLVFDGNGNLYGTASTGGNGYGVVFAITP